MLNLKFFSKEKSFDFFLPIAFILSILPLIVRMKIVNLDDSSMQLFGSLTQIDFFSQNKSFFLLFSSIFLINISIIFSKKIFSKKDTISNCILISCGIFFLFTFLSAIFSKHRDVSLYGLFDRAEGLITITCYIILFIYSIYTFRNINSYKYILTSLFILISINAFLGFFQYTGHDFFNTPLGTSIIVPNEYQKEGFQLSFNSATSIYGTLYNSNYIGSFAAIVLPIFFGLTIFENNIISKTILFLGTALSIFLLFGSNARSGFISVFCTLVFGVILFGKLLLNKRKVVSLFILCILVLSIGMYLGSKEILNKITALNEDVTNIVTNTSDFNYMDYIPVKDIKHINKDVQVILANESIKISYENNTYVFKNSKNETIQYMKANNTYTTSNKDFESFSFVLTKSNEDSNTFDTITLQFTNNLLFKFKLYDDNSIHLINYDNNQDIDVVFPETFGFNGKEKLASGRGYIWSRSIPLLKDNLLLGSGPDTFAFDFPQNDLMGKYFSFNSPNIIVDKPHNLYLQIALNSGVIALIGFMGVILIYIIDSFNLYALKNEYEKSEILGSVTSLSIVGYLISGIFNDSVISVAPIFWTILGIGIALNFINRNNKKREL